MKFQHYKVFTRFCALLLAVVASLLLCVPAFAAYGYGSTPTYATGNYSYNSSTSYETSTSSADWFTAVLAQLRTMYSFIFSKLKAIDTAVGFCQSYLAEIRDNTKKLITIDSYVKNIYDSIAPIKTDVNAIKTQQSTANTHIGIIDTNTSKIYSQVLKLATEVTASKILTAVQSIDTDGLATEKTLSDLNSKAATELTLSSINSKVATDAHISDIYSQLTDLLSDGFDYQGNAISFSPGYNLNIIRDSLEFLSPLTENTSIYWVGSNGKWAFVKPREFLSTAFRFSLNSDEYTLNPTSVRDRSLYSILVNRLDNLVLMNYRLVDQLADAEDEKLKDATEDRRTTVTDYIKSDGTNDKYADSLGLAQTVTGGLETGVTMSDANTFVDGVLNGDSDSDYWSWFTQATADDLDRASSGSAARLAPRSPSQSTYWVIDPNATADDYIDDWRSSNG